MPLDANGFPVVNPDFETFQKVRVFQRRYKTVQLRPLAVYICKQDHIDFVYWSDPLRHTPLLQSYFYWPNIQYFSMGPVYPQGRRDCGLYDTLRLELHSDFRLPEAAHGQKGRCCVHLTPTKVYAIASILIDVAMLSIP